VLRVHFAHEKCVLAQILAREVVLHLRVGRKNTRDMPRRSDLGEAMLQ
jgi:hypothetical protein